MSGPRFCSLYSASLFRYPNQQLSQPVNSLHPSSYLSFHGGHPKFFSKTFTMFFFISSEGSLSFTAADGLVYVTADSKERLIEGYGAEGDGSSDAYSCLMDLQGAIVADAATLAASGADLSADFDGRYLQDGYWLLGEREGGLVAYAENGKVAGIAPAPEHGVDVTLYPDTEPCYT